MLLKQLDPETTVSVDTDWFYRKGAKGFMWLVNKPIAYIEYNIVGEAYEFLIQKPILKVAHYLRVFDTEAVDGTVNGIGRITLAWSSVMRIIQNGQVQYYALMMAFGAFVLVTWFIFW
jgi:multicomponent Na+:H+ antiporter subunit D